MAAGTAGVVEAVNAGDGAIGGGTRHEADGERAPEVVDRYVDRKRGCR